MVAVHPRTCGEYIIASRPSNVGTGSSPHVRGIPAWFGSPPAKVRFIPARAGNTAIFPV